MSDDYYICLDCEIVQSFSQDGDPTDTIEWLTTHWGHNALIVWHTSDNELNPEMLNLKFKEKYEK